MKKRKNSNTHTIKHGSIFPSSPPPNIISEGREGGGRNLLSHIYSGEFTNGGEWVACDLGGEWLCVPLRASSAAGIAEGRGMLGFGEGIMSTGIGMFVSVL